MRIKVILIFFIVSFSLFATEFPVKKETYLFKSDDLFSMGMGNASVALQNKEGVGTNPASIAGLTENYIIATYKYYDYKDIISKKIQYKNDLSSLYLVTGNAAVYIKTLHAAEEEHVLGDYNHKYNFDLREIGLAVLIPPENPEDGFYGGFTIKGYLGSMLDAKINNNNSIDYLITDRGLGIGLDLGMIYKKSGISLGLAWNDILSQIFWNKYSNMTVNGTINAGAGFDMGLTKIGVNIKKILIDESAIELGAGAEVTLLSFPKEYSFFMMEDGSLKVRTGMYGEDVFGNKKEFTYGAEFSNSNLFIDLATASKNINVFDDYEQNVYKLSIGYKIK